MDNTVHVQTPALPPLSFAPRLRHANQTLNAVSFGFIATAVLFAMFLVMAIFERILRPHRAARAAARDEERAESIPESTADSQKPELCHSDSYSRAVSVLMPGQDYPTYFARPIPSPGPPEYTVWPLHEASSEIDLSEKENLNEKGRGEASASAPSHTEVFQGVETGKGESSSPHSPEREHIQDLEKARVESSTSASSGKEPLQDPDRN